MLFLKMQGNQTEIRLHIHCRVHIVHVFLIQLLSQQLHRFTNTDNMKYSKRATNTYYWVRYHMVKAQVLYEIM